MSEETAQLSSATANSEIPQGRILRSWKEVAEYMSRGIRTVQRWEKQLNLPVHRIANRGEVFAFTSEIDGWLQNFAKSSHDSADGDVENWRALAEQATQEEDPEKLLQLINRLNEILRTSENRASRNRPNDGPTPPVNNAA